MAGEIEETLKEVAKRIGEFINDAATMNVETWYVDVGAQGIGVDETGAINLKKSAKPAAQTTLRFDGDSVGVVPMRKGAGGELEVHMELLDLHERNVRTATMYRASILNSLVGVLKEYV
jgi:hypothetical protein